MADPMEFSPFDAPVKDVKPNTGGGGVKMEQITDAELDGGKSNVPKDAPEFVIPDFDQIPNAEMPGGGKSPDPFAPGSADDPFTPPGAKGGSQGSGGVNMDSQFQKEFTEYTAKFLIDIFFRLLVAGLCQFAKIDRKEILIAIDEGHIDSKFLQFVDEANVNVEREINVTEDEKRFIIEPLKYFMETKKVQLSPGTMVGLAFLMVTAKMGIKAWEVKQQNKAILDRIIKESAELKNAAREGRSSNRWSGRQSDPEVANFSTVSPETETFTVEPDKNPSSDDEIVEITNVEEMPNDDNI